MALQKLVELGDTTGDGEVVGYVVGESKPYRAEILAFRPLAMGEYLYMEYHGYRVLAFVANSITGSTIISRDLIDPRDVERLVKSVRVGERLFYHRGVIKILGSMEDNGHKLHIPAIPPPPGTEVYKAPKTVLETVFSPRRHGYVRIGALLREPETEVRVNINKIVSRHLGVLAMTGMGKSNLVALIAKRVEELGGTIVIFDYHGEYTSLRNTTLIKPVLDPLRLTLDELARLLNIPRNATRQRMVLKECLDSIDLESAKEFFNVMKRCVQGRVARYGISAQKVLDSLTVYENFLKRILKEDSGDVMDRIVVGSINVVDLSELHLNHADAVIAHWLSRLLEARKASVWSNGSRGFPTPLIAVIEEAHVFIPADEETATKYSASLVAREGRKFGLGLVIVSQRPRGLDPTILSQLGNLAILRIVHPEDQAYIAKYCEPVMQDVMEELPGLNIGEAILLGEWVPIPAATRIDLVSEKVSGMDIDAVGIWSRYGKRG
ncbi:MAG: ATP-binding protein [Ignisphaera sp.]